MIELEIRNLSLKSDQEVLFESENRKISLEGITAVLGKNGAGKSLFLEMIQGILTPSQGQISISGQNGRAIRSAYIFQKPTVLRRSVFENVALPLRASGQTDGLEKKVHSILERVELAQKSDLPAILLSGGEAQRMGVARALVNNPDLVLMDEPTSNLDNDAANEFEKLIISFTKSDIAFLWASHNLEQMQKIATQFIVIDKGRLRDVSSAQQFSKAKTQNTNLKANGI